MGLRASTSTTGLGMQSSLPGGGLPPGLPRRPAQSAYGTRPPPVKKQAWVEGPSLLTEEEKEALKPQEVKVENPWIYEQTHQEYLDNIKVSRIFELN